MDKAKKFFTSPEGAQAGGGALHFMENSYRYSREGFMTYDGTNHTFNLAYEILVRRVHRA
jgi:hypothetical protein